MPPILSVELLDIDKLPPAAVLLAVKEPRSNVPAETERFPLIFAFARRVTMFPVLEMVRLLKAVAKLPPIDCAVVPLKVTAEVPAASAVAEALFAQFPAIVMLKLLVVSVPEVNVNVFAMVIPAGNKSPLVLVRVRL